MMVRPRRLEPRRRHGLESLTSWDAWLALADDSQTADSIQAAFFAYRIDSVLPIDALSG
jgi:hypothetical protein